MSRGRVIVVFLPDLCRRALRGKPMPGSAIPEKKSVYGCPGPEALLPIIEFGGEATYASTDEPSAMVKVTVEYEVPAFVAE